uniref:Uncharacterized protein n=1 Tax=Quercus lobata TaxID=97700 RepID=A0A7N2KUT3_QUELO
MHALWLCEQVQSVRKSEHRFCLLYQKQYRSFMDILFETVLDRGSSRVVFYKANFDAAFFENVGVASIGIAVRDSNANSIAALSKRIRMPHSVELQRLWRAAVLFLLPKN